MCSIYLFFVIIFIYFELILTVPQVFNNEYNFCEFHSGSSKDKIIFPNKVWNAYTKDFVIYFSFCKVVQTVCFNQTSSCIIKKESKELVDLGREFLLVSIDDYIFESVNGMKCPYLPNRNYTLTVILECSDTLKQTPQVTSEDLCNFEITMMKPDCQPKCTDLISNQYLIDLRRFPKNIELNSDTRKFIFSVCGSSTNCGSRDFSACEIVNNDIIPLAEVKSQTITYDVSNNALLVKGRYKVPRERAVRELYVLIKCNWQTEVSNVVYKMPLIQGKKYKFELESSYGCIKLPQNCYITSVNNLNYNLSNIYKEDGWRVANVPEGEILLNICGVLETPQNTTCSEQSSQVCHFYNNTYINRGSILSSLTVDAEIIKGKISSGSFCQQNVLYSTEIEFHCSRFEQGPVFKEYKHCILVLKWKTPHACPIHIYKSQNCYINNKLGNRNLQKLFMEVDKTYTLSEDGQSKLVYNLCGPIHEKCNDFYNVSFCLKNEQHGEMVVGWDNREVISDNGLLRMELTGDKCFHGKRNSQVIVNFVCNFGEHQKLSQIYVVEDSCIFNVSVFTSFACLSDNTFRNCDYKVGNITYDLSPLVRKDQNYRIKDEDNLEFILNVCGPIINEPDAFCRKDTMICLKNLTEININHQYVSLGEVAAPTLHNNNLVIEAAMGGFCESYDYYKSVIHFECSDKKFAPLFLSRTSCTYNFIWKTPEACPIKENCVISNTEILLNLTELNEKLFKFTVNNHTIEYEFNLCQDHFLKHTDGRSTRHNLKRIIFHENGSTQMKFELEQNSQKKCDNNNMINEVLFEFHCVNRSNNNFKPKNFTNCHLEMIIQTHIVCEDTKVIYSYSVEVSESPETLEFIQTTNFTQESKCSIISENTGYHFRLSSLKSKEVYNGTTKYSLNFDGKSNCSGVLCKNETQILPANICPVISFDNQNNVIKLSYSTESICQDDENLIIIILLKCINTIEDKENVMSTSCKLTVEINSLEACYLFNERTASSNTIIIVSVVGSLIIVMFLLFVFIYSNRWRINHLTYRNIRRSRDKSSIPIYLRNCSE